jgi:malonyl-CoA/methylmalonyl-CoA synthetase
VSGSFYHALAAAFSTHADRPFLSAPGNAAVTFKEFEAMAARYAGAFLAAGAQAGDRIALQAEKSVEAIACYVGALKAGLAYLPLNTAYTDDETSYFLADAEPAIFIRDPSRTMLPGPLTFTLDAVGEGTMAGAARAATPLAQSADCSPDDLAAILYTSGTTGRSKGAMLSHRNLQSNAQTLVDLWDINAADRLVHALPVFHIHGLFVALNTIMLAGAEAIFLPAFDAAVVRAALRRATLMMGVPTFYSRLLADQNFGREDCGHMRLFVSGSAPLTIETHQAFKARTGFEILERYGMSEAGMIASNPLHGARVAGTVGYALPGVSVRVTGAKAPLPFGETGAVEAKGPNVFKGYWRKEKQTAQSFTSDGWFITGDVGWLSEDGRLTLAGREKDLIIVGGLNVYPPEIETILDAVEGVAESAVVGAPHADMGEGVVAFLILRPGAARPPEELLADALAPLARFKRPRKFYFVETLPRNAMGKVQKHVLRAAAADAFQAPV